MVAFAENDEKLVGQSAKRQAVTISRKNLICNQKINCCRRMDDPAVEKDMETTF